VFVLSASAGFTPDERERSRRYHRPRHVALLANLGLSFATLGVLTQLRLPFAWWINAVATPAVVELALGAVHVPVAVWRFRQDRAYGLSTQTNRGFAVDIAKGTAVGTALTVASLAPLFALAHWWPHGWPIPAALGAAAFVVFLGFVAPLVLEPVFNRFRPLDDRQLADRLRSLADAAGAPVRDVLVADASRRTTRHNAYVSGLGRTRRVVVWDTLLAGPEDEIALVVAHELGHRARRHVAQLTAVAAASLAAFVVVVRLALPQPRPHDTALILLLGLVCELATLPPAAALSRRFEREADRFSLALTGDRTAYIGLHERLALANLAELDPPKWLYYWLFSHPTPSQRLDAA
jgi:STE24 endopeptidase